MEILLVIVSLILGIFGLILFTNWLTTKIRTYYGWPEPNDEDEE